MQKTLILIPARFASTRFPGKPLSLINNKPMIIHVVDAVRKMPWQYSVVTDNDEIESLLKENNLNVCRVDDDVRTGSERIYLAWERFFKKDQYDFIVNLQGDEPLIQAQLIEDLISSQVKLGFDVMTIVRRRSSSEIDFENPNIVKCLYSEDSATCLYFSRARIPYSVESKKFDWFQHIGLYSYRVSALKKFVQAQPSRLEKLENLEQLRAMELGLKIGAIESNLNLMGVDTPEDIKKIEGVLSGKKE